MNTNIFRVSDIPEHENIYLKKGWFGEWRVVHPHKNEDGTPNLINIIFGSKSNIIYLCVLILLIIGLYVGINELISSYKDVAANPCDYCKGAISLYPNISLNDTITIIGGASPNIILVMIDGAY